MVTAHLAIEKKNNEELAHTNNFSGAHLLWLVYTLEYFQCAVAYQLLRSKTKLLEI